MRAAIIVPGLIVMRCSSRMNWAAISCLSRANQPIGGSAAVGDEAQALGLHCVGLPTRNSALIT
jgi:hypothetical protein